MMSGRELAACVLGIWAGFVILLLGVLAFAH